VNNLQFPLLIRLGHFLHRPWRDQWLFIEVYALLGFARLAIDSMKFKNLANHLGTPMLESPPNIPALHLKEARRVAWALRTASRYTPWKSNCFPQAIVAKFLLSRKGIQSTLYLGAAFKARTEMEAHAWLRCGPLYVTGGRGYRRFGTVGIFG
jgi:hypothetical protein